MSVTLAGITESITGGEIGSFNYASYEPTEAAMGRLKSAVACSSRIGDGSAILYSGNARAQDACVAFGALPPPANPLYSSVAAMCAAPRGTPLPDALIPPLDADTEEEKNAYNEALKAYLVAKNYGDWIHDSHWRMTGDYEGCPEAGGLNFGVHNIVRIYYAPEVIQWLCEGRNGPLSDGAAVIKEEHLFESAADVIVNPATNQMGAPQDLTPQVATIMLKRREGSFDGWYWGAMVFESDGNPLILGRSGFTIAGVESPVNPDASWYPTGAISVVYPLDGFGQMCLNCHSSADSQHTFSSINNIMGNEMVFMHSNPVPSCT